MTMERQSRIEMSLCEEFAAEGYQVQKDNGNFVALVEVTVLAGLKEWAIIDLTRLAEVIDRRLT